MRLMGAALVTLAGVMAGFFWRQRLAQILQTRRRLYHMLTMLSFELNRFQRPLPELFYALSQTQEGSAGALCRRVSEAMEQGMLFSQAWTEAVGTMDIREREILLPLGAVLGRYGASEQLVGVERCCREMERAVAQAGQTLQERGRLYMGLSAVGSLMLAILLM